MEAYDAASQYDVFHCANWMMTVVTDVSETLVGCGHIAVTVRELIQEAKLFFYGLIFVQVLGQDSKDKVVDTRSRNRFPQVGW